MIAESGKSADYWMTIEQGIHGGHMIDDDLFGMAHHPSVIIDSPSQFDFYSGGGLDIALLGMAAMDGAGNVNVSKLNRHVNGPGGFVDIPQNANTVPVFGALHAQGSPTQERAGRQEKI